MGHGDPVVLICKRDLAVRPVALSVLGAWPDQDVDGVCVCVV